MKTEEVTHIIDFLKNAERLKSTLRSGYTSAGRKESVAEHTWRLCLMALILEKYFTDVDFSRLIKICIVHDLGEAIRGDIPAPEQSAGNDKAEVERLDLLKLLEPLPEDIHDRIVELWDEYEQASTPEARLAKVLDKLETILQHNQGENPEDFDYRFNLGYGQQYTSRHPLIAALRSELDEETKQRAKETDPE